MNQPDPPKPNRAQRRQAQRELRKAIKSGVGLGVTLAGYRVVGPDGSVKVAVGKQPDGRRE